MKKTTSKIAVVAAIAGGVIAAATSASASLNLPAQNCSITLTANLKRGMRHPQVVQLQQLLNKYPQTTVATTGAGSAGMETDFFGPATHNAVVKFQNLHASDVLTPAGLSVGNGNVFALTRAVLNQICMGTAVVTPTPTPTTTAPITPTPVTPVSGPVTAALGASVPYTVLVAGQASARLADFTFSGNGAVNSVKLMRTGVSTNSTLNNVYLYDGSTRLTGAASVLADGSINFNNAAGLFMVSGTRNITVRADIAAGTSGQSVGMSLVGYTTLGVATMTPTMLNGTQLPIASVALANVNLAGSNVAANTSLNSGTSDYTVWSQQLSVGTRSVKLNRATFRMIGSAPTNALSGVKLFLNGVQVGQTASFDTAGYATFDMTAMPVIVNTGTQNFEVRADVVAGASRDFYVTLENTTDLLVEDSSIPGVYVSVGNSFNNVGGKQTIGQGNLTISQDPAFMTTQVVGGATNVVIGQYRLQAYGEDVRINSLTVLPVLTAMSPAAAGLNNVSLYVNGGQYGSSVNWTANNIPFNNLGFVLPAGSSTIVTVKADVVTTGGTPYTAGQVRADMIAGSNNAQGVVSGSLASTPSVGGRVLSVVSGNLNFGLTSGFNAQNINPNTQNVKLGSFTLQASNADSIRVTSLSVPVSVTGMALTGVTNLVVKDETGAAVANPISMVNNVNNFSVNTVIPASGSKTFSVYADIVTAANGNTVKADMSVNYNGIANYTPQTANATGVTMTVGTATLAAATPVVNATPVSQYVAPGAKEMATFNVKSTNGASTITKITFNTSGLTGVNSITVGGVTKGLIQGGATLIVDGLNIAVPNSNSGVAVKVDANYNQVGVGQTTSNQGNQISIADIEYNSGNGVFNTGVLAGATSNTFTLVSSMPTAVKGTGAFVSSGAASSFKLGTISVTANASGDINIKTLPVNVGMPSGTASNITLKQNGVNVAGVNCTAGANTICTFSTVYRVQAGTTANFDVSGDTAAVTTTGNSSVNAGPAASFTWDDTNAAAGSLDGTKVNNYGN